MIMIQSVVLVTLLSFSFHQQASAAETVLFVTHSSKLFSLDLFDAQKFDDGIERVIEIARKNSFQIVNNERFLTSKDEGTPYMNFADHKVEVVKFPLPADWYVQGIASDERNFSEMGEHRVMGTANRIVSVGGNLSFCLCRTVRDALAFTTKKGIVPEIDIITDAVYEGQDRLTDLINNLGQKEFLKYLMSYFAAESGMLICGSRSPKDPIVKVRAKVMLNGEELGHLGKEVGLHPSGQEASLPSTINFLTIDNFILKTQGKAF